MAVNFQQKPRRGLFGSLPGMEAQPPPIASQQLDTAPGLGMRSPTPQPAKRSILPYALAAIEDTLSRQMGYQPQGVARLNAQRQTQLQQAAEAAAAQRKRAEDFADWRAREDYQRANRPPPSPTLREDNAGNVWQFDPQSGQPMGDKPVWIDPTEKVIYQDGMQIRVPNPYRTGAAPAPQIIGADLPEDWEIEGGGASNGSGNFPR